MAFVPLDAQACAEYKLVRNVREKYVRLFEEVRPGVNAELPSKGCFSSLLSASKHMEPDPGANPCTQLPHAMMRRLTTPKLCASSSVDHKVAC